MRSKHTYDDDFGDDSFLRWQRKVCIITCVMVSVLAVLILIYVFKDCVDLKHRGESVELVWDDSTNATTWVPEEAPTEAPTEEPSEPPTEAPTQAPTEAPTEPPTEPQPEPIENLQDNLSGWFMERHQDTSPLTIWKKSDNEGNLLVAVRSEDGQTLVTFQFDREEYEKQDYRFEDKHGNVHQFKWLTESYEEWTQCTKLCSWTTAKEVVDATFVGYHEVSGNYLPNTQFQVRVLFNRVKGEGFPDDINGVITQRGQYACKTVVVNRYLKSDSFIEKEDLEKCFRAVLLVYADETVVEVPEDVIWAAAFKQGHGLWEEVRGTYYCHR